MAFVPVDRENITTSTGANSLAASQNTDCCGYEGLLEFATVYSGRNLPEY